MTTPEWLTLDDDETVEWVGEPGVASKMDLFIFGAALLPAIGLGLLIMVPAYRAVRNTEYAVTDRAVYVKSGVLSSSVERIAYEDLRSTGYDESFWEQGSGRGTVELYASPSAAPVDELAAIPDARAIEERIRELSDAASAGGGGGPAGASGVSSAGTESLRDVRGDLSRAVDALETVETAIERAATTSSGDVTGSTGPGGQASDDAAAPGAAAELTEYREAIESVRATVDRSIVADADDRDRQDESMGGTGEPGGTPADIGAAAGKLARIRESLETIESAVGADPSTGQIGSNDGESSTDTIERELFRDDE